MLTKKSELVDLFLTVISPSDTQYNGKTFQMTYTEHLYYKRKYQYYTKA